MTCFLNLARSKDAHQDVTPRTITALGLHSTLREAAHDILHLSEDEPYGVRGATVIIKLKQKTTSNKCDEETLLGVIAIDSNTVSQFL